MFKRKCYDWLPHLHQEERGGIVIPSEEERIPLHPLDFEEYLWAMELSIYADEIQDAFENRRALPDAVHRKVMRIFDEYMLVGGMPQSVVEFAKTKDFAKCSSKKSRLSTCTSRTWRSSAMPVLCARD